MSAAALRAPPQPEAAATLRAPAAGRERPDPAVLVQELALATRGLTQTLARGGQELAELGEDLPPHLLRRLRGLFFALESAAARQQAAAGALALHLGRGGPG